MAAPMESKHLRCTATAVLTWILCVILCFPSTYTSQNEDCRLQENSHDREKYSESTGTRCSAKGSSKLQTKNCDSTVGVAAEKEIGKSSAANERPPASLKFDDWCFDKQQLLIETFPLDPIAENFVRQVKGAIFSKVLPIPMKTATHLVAVSEPALTILDLDDRVWNSELFKSFVSGNTFLPGSTPIAHRYGGHQFGYWSGQLGDGRAVMLGEYLNRNGERWELQLKGSGQTPYSRHGDGRAVLRSSVREFLCSEAMHHLGIPTSRAVSLSVSLDPVWRDQFYDGHPKTEPAAVVLRMAPSWFRIGSLEILAKNGELDLLRKLVDFVIQQYFPLVDSGDSDRYVAFYAGVVSQTADLMAKWMSVGFTHGVMNTDNFSLLSLTIDYGPFGFLDAYNPEFVPNTSDDEARYSYEKQPDVGHFNMDQLRQALLPLLDGNQARHLLQILDGYAGIYKSRFMEIFRKKLGLVRQDEEDEYIVGLLLKIMEDTSADFSMTFRQLGALSVRDLTMNNIPDELWALKDLQGHSNFQGWIGVYTSRCERAREETSQTSREEQMNAVNPRYILRNWMAQEAIAKAEAGDYSDVSLLMHILQNPFTEQVAGERANYAQRPPEWARDIRVSCSS